MNVVEWAKIGIGIAFIFAVTVRGYAAYKQSGLDASFLKGFIDGIYPKEKEKNETREKNDQDYAEAKIALRLIENCILDNENITIENRRLALNFLFKIKACCLGEDV